MNITKKAATLMFIYITAAMFVLGGFIYQSENRVKACERRLALNYGHAFSELSSSLDKMSDSLKKSLYATSPSMVSTLCAEAYSRAASARMAFSILPYSNMELEKTSAFISKTGDYVYYLLKNSAGGKLYTDEEYKNLSELSKDAALLAEQIDELQAAVLAGKIDLASIDDKGDASSGNEKDGADSGADVSSLTSGFKQLESEFPEMPSLIYDGPFSESISEGDARFLKGKDEISEEDALGIASSYSGASKKIFRVDSLREGAIPVYIVSGVSRGGHLSLEITKQGGAVLYYDNSRPVGEGVISSEDSVNIAENYLKKHGFDSMAATYWEKAGNEVTVNFAYSQNGVICYPDLIKVTVALDSGSVTGFDSLNYINNHTKRDLPTTYSCTPEQAKGKLFAEVNVIKCSQAVIPTEGKNEIFCHEFKCKDKDGNHCLIYVNAETGAEEKILLLIEDENGTLTI